MARWPRHVWTSIFTYADSIRTVSAAVPAGVRLGEGLDFLMTSEPDRLDVANEN